MAWFFLREKWSSQDPGLLKSQALVIVVFFFFLEGCVLRIPQGQGEFLLFITQYIGKRTISHGRCPTNKCSPKEQMNRLSHHSASFVVWSQLSFSVSLFTTLISSGQISFSLLQILKVNLNAKGNTTPES